MQEVENFWKNFNDSDKLKVLKDAVNILSAFIENVPGGCSYWIDKELKEHTADMGYIVEFLDDLEKYINLKLSH